NGVGRRASPTCMPPYASAPAMEPGLHDPFPPQRLLTTAPASDPPPTLGEGDRGGATVSGKKIACGKYSIVPEPSRRPPDERDARLGSSYDLVVVGSGTGLMGAITAARRGLRTL